MFHISLCSGSIGQSSSHCLSGRRANAGGRVVRNSLHSLSYILSARRISYWESSLHSGPALLQKSTRRAWRTRSVNPSGPWVSFASGARCIAGLDRNPPDRIRMRPDCLDRRLAGSQQIHISDKAGSLSYPICRRCKTPFDAFLSLFRACVHLCQFQPSEPPGSHFQEYPKRLWLCLHIEISIQHTTGAERGAKSPQHQNGHMSSRDDRQCCRTRSEYLTETCP